jgi:nucleotide-binding universal stress UspA family protein
MFETVIWATDGSPMADRALPAAKELASHAGSKLVVLHVRELLVGRAGGYPVYADEDETVERIKKQAEELRDQGFTITLKLVTALDPNPAHALAESITDLGGDIVVVGTRGRGPVAGLFLGSVTQRLLHVAPCPVLAVPPLVREPDHEPPRTLAGAAQ